MHGVKCSTSKALPAQHRAVLRVVHADGLVVRRNEQARAAAVEAAPANRQGSTAERNLKVGWALVGWKRASIDVQTLLHHSDVPNADTSICVTRCDCVATKIKRRVVAGVAVSVQCLNAESGARIPKRNSFVPTAGAYVV